MLELNEIIEILKSIALKYSDFKLGVAGSYANGKQHMNSDLDIVIDGDSTRLDIENAIKSKFNINVDILWVELMRQEDEELDAFSLENGLSINEHSVFKTVMNEVKWV